MMNRLLFIVLLLLFIDAELNAQDNDFSRFLPDDYYVVEELYADLSNDKQEDYVLLIKKKDSNNVIQNRFGETVDRNRRGLVILFKDDKSFQLASENYICFSSENEDGGVYYPPQLKIELQKGMLVIGFGHGRYGNWQYSFVYNGSDFELFNYKSVSSNGPVIEREVNIDFVRKLKTTKEYIDDEGNDEGDAYKEIQSPIELVKAIKLSEVSDFDQINFNKL